MDEERQYKAVRPNDDPTKWLNDVMYLLWIEETISYDEYDSVVGWARNK